MLYLVSTPIGNLSDISFRAVETLKNSDYILCEDTRHSSHLLKHYEIKTSLKSYHRFSEAAKEEAIITDLKQGKVISLISDAGTPGISDPGERLVKRCRKESLPVVPIPGPSAAIAALSASGLDTNQFQFIGFLPKKSSELKQTLIRILHYFGTTICYESPKRIQGVLKTLLELDPNRVICVARELTKKFESFYHGSVKEVIESFKGQQVKGEVTLLIAGDPEGMKALWAELTPREHVDLLIRSYDISEKEAIKIAAELRGVPKRQVYNELK